MNFHDVLHGFHAGRGTWTSIVELNFAQDLASVDRGPLFLVLLDLQKAYDNLDCGRLLKTLEGYGAEKKNRDILKEFWEQ